MDAAKESREREKQKLLARLAELMVEEQADEGVFLSTPHYSVLERAARRLGEQAAREAQQRAAREVAARCDATAACPGCGEPRPVVVKKRIAESLDGPVELAETTAYCRPCRRSFFPSTRSDGAG